MPSAAINPTRQELTRLKERLRTARRGHKLLKDKRDEMMRRFLETVRESRALRREVDEGLLRARGAFTAAAGLMSAAGLETALLCPAQSAALEVRFRSVLSVKTPEYRLRRGADGEGCPYGFAFTSGELDDAADALAAVFQDMLRLAAAEKTVQLLAGEIERTRRRVNALEYVKIPEMEEALRAIAMKLDENERSATVRLMKVKDLLLKESIEARRAEDARVLDADPP